MSTGDVVPFFNKSEKMAEVGAFCEVTKGVFLPSVFFFFCRLPKKKNVQTKQRFQQESVKTRGLNVLLEIHC